MNNAILSCSVQGYSLMERKKTEQLPPQIYIVIVIVGCPNETTAINNYSSPAINNPHCVGRNATITQPSVGQL